MQQHYKLVHPLGITTTYSGLNKIICKGVNDFLMTLLVAHRSHFIARYFLLQRSDAWTS